jgi:hypothetical protein
MLFIWSWAIKFNFCILVVPLNKAVVFCVQILDIFYSISIRYSGPVDSWCSLVLDQWTFWKKINPCLPQENWHKAVFHLPSVVMVAFWCALIKKRYWIWFVSRGMYWFVDRKRKYCGAPMDHYTVNNMVSSDILNNTIKGNNFA